jgi:hypothetical protein
VSDLSGAASVVIAAPLERCFAIAADVERAPGWQGAMRTARAVEYGAGGRASLVQADIDVRVATVSLLLRFDYDEPHGLTWTREGVRGPAEASVRALLTERPLTGLKKEAESAISGYPE